MRVMYYRRKIILALLEALGRDVSAKSMQKYLFLFTRRQVGEKAFDFVPYKYGCFSFQANQDLVALSKQGYLDIEKIEGHSMFLYELNKNGITMERMKNKQGKVYGLKFSYAGQSFKASEIGREFGYRSLQKNFEAANKEETKKPRQTIQEPTEKKEQSDTGYQLVPPSRSSISRDNYTPQIAQAIGAVASTAINTAEELVSGLGDMISPTTQGADYAEAAWQRRLRYQANRKKRRGRGL